MAEIKCCGLPKPGGCTFVRCDQPAVWRVIWSKLPEGGLPLELCPFHFREWAHRIAGVVEGEYDDEDYFILEPIR
jgi:ribosomal protein S14